MLHGPDLPTSPPFAISKSSLWSFTALPPEMSLLHSHWLNCYCLVLWGSFQSSFPSLSSRCPTPHTHTHTYSSGTCLCFLFCFVCHKILWLFFSYSFLINFHKNLSSGLYPLMGYEFFVVKENITYIWISPTLETISYTKTTCLLCELIH